MLPGERADRTLCRVGGDIGDLDVVRFRLEGLDGGAAKDELTARRTGVA